MAGLELLLLLARNYARVQVEEKDFLQQGRLAMDDDESGLLTGHSRITHGCLRSAERRHRALGSTKATR